ncbi:uncharacterized protein ighd [Eucyclogobius newberryi]|uniref:uncharacterized protein ighd n=1 Tax=Eucyclogobius newberryi TaxID=166745 RepID=UPI003B5D030D
MCSLRMDTLTLLSAALCLLCVKCETLTQPASVTVQPGHTLTISCSVSYSVSSYYTAWIRQPAGKGLEWIGMKHTGASYYKDSLKNKFSIDLDTSSNTVTLTGQNMQPGDTAVYYCARDHSHTKYYFDYWGKGTSVTVTSATPTAPTVFPVMPCNTDSGNTVTLACLATGFTPSSVSFTWTHNDTALTDSIQYPSVLKNDVYSGVSQIRVRREDWDQRHPFKCRVEHASGNREVDFVKPNPRVISPNITLYPTWEGDFLDAPVKLTCMLSGFYPNRLTVSWARDNQPLLDSAPIERSYKSTQGSSTFTLSSQIEPDMNQWQSGSSFTCTALHMSTPYDKSINICKSIPNTPPAVRLEIPSFRTVVMADSEITATCFVQSIVKASLTWLLDGNVPSPDQVYEASNRTHVISNLTLTPSEWKQLPVLTCKAEHLCLPTTEQNIKISAPEGPAPVVSIRRSLPDLLKGDNAVLECDITSLSSTDLYVTFQSNGRDISSKDFVHLSEGAGLQSITRRFSVPKNHWKKENLFSCKVSQGFSKHFPSSSTGSIFVDPSVKLLLAPSDESGDQTLLCTAQGFNPHIEWLSGSQNISSGSNVSISLNAEGPVVVSSQLQVSQTEWKTGKVFSCQVSDKSLNKRVQEDISVCAVAGHLKALPVLLVETPSFQTVMTSTSGVTASCSVCTVFEAKVSWWMDDSRVQSHSVRQYMNSSHIISELTLPPSQWKTLGRVSCRAEHVCFPTTEKTVRVAAPEGPTPEVSIRRSLPDLLKGDSAVLECDITSLSSTDLYVTFQSNGRDISSKDFVHLSEGAGLQSITRRFSVPKNHWKKENLFSCKVSQGFSKHFPSSSTGSIFVDPSVKLLLAPSDESGDQTLLCTAQGFNPHIEWLSGSQNISSGSNVSISLNAEGPVVVSSQLQVSQTEWKTGKVFSCQVSDKSLNKRVQEDISVCAVTPLASKTVGVYVQGPALEQLQNNDQILTVSCLLVGPSLDSFTVTWKVDEKIESGGVHTEAPVVHSNGTQTLQSQLSLSAQDWNSNKPVSCEAKHLCSNHSWESKESTSKSTVLSPPTVRLTDPNLLGLPSLDSVSLDCLVSGFYPPDVIISWEKNGIRVPSSSQTNAPLWQDKDGVTYSTSSRLNISKSLEEDSTYSCVVRHESSDTPFRSNITDVFASVILTLPSAVLLRGDHELVCLVTGFSPAHINISWFLDNSTQLHGHNTSDVLRGPDGKFSIQSHLRLAPTDMLPGALHTCRVTHTTATIDVHAMQKENVEECNFLDHLLHTDEELDSGLESWYMACVFLLCFLLSVVYCVCVTLVKTK